MYNVYAVWCEQSDDSWITALFETKEQADICCDRLRQSERGKFVVYRVEDEILYANWQEYDDDQQKIMSNLIRAAEKVGNLFADQHEGKAFDELADAIQKAKTL